METRGFQSYVYIVPEVTWGTSVTNPSYLRLSNMVQSVRWGLDVGKQGMRSISTVDVEDFLKGKDDITVEITYRLQRADPLDTCMTKTAGVVPSYQVEIGVNTGSSTGDAYYTLNGVRWNVSVSVDQEDYILVTLSGVAKTMTAAQTQPSVGTGSREASLNTTTYPFLTWKGASVTKGGSAWGAFVAGFNFSVENNFDAPAQLGSNSVGAIVDGPRDISGSGDLYIDDGGFNYHADVNGDASTTIVFNTGPTGSPRFTLNSCEFGAFSMEVNDTDALVRTAVPFMARTITVGTV